MSFVWYPMLEITCLYNLLNFDSDFYKSCFLFRLDILAEMSRKSPLQPINREFGYFDSFIPEYMSIWPTAVKLLLIMYRESHPRANLNCIKHTELLSIQLYRSTKGNCQYSCHIFHKDNGDYNMWCKNEVIVATLNRKK